jgi:hypothetical protein
MIFEVGQHVKCFLRTSTIIEGIVQESSERQLILKSLDGENLLIVHQPIQDIVLTKVLLSKKAPEELQKNLSSKPPAAFQHETLNQAFEATVAEGEEEPDPMALQAKTTAQLRIELAKEERKILAAKLRDHHPNSAEAPRKITYGYPGFFKK